ncbi:MAG: sensor histidine kinase [Acidobacteriota bacterium]
MPRRRFAIALACVVAGVFQAVHTLAFERTLAITSVAFAMAETAVELVALTALYDRLRRFSLAWSAVLALSLGVALAFAASVLHPLPAAIVAQIGLFDGLLGLGLWALAVVVPSRTFEAEQLRAQAELERLRATLQPHFLLNTLNTIAGLVVDDPHQARELVAALADLLRDSLAAEPTHTVADEVAWMQRYAEIIETRHRGQIRFRWDIAAATRGLRLPRLLLQPLVENAIHHGALRRREGGEVGVRTELAAGRVICVVEDNGPGPAGPRDGALGLSLVTRRLELELAGRGAFRLERTDEVTRSIVELPAESA